MDCLFKPDYISIVMRKDKIFQPYKNAFIQQLLNDETTSKMECAVIDS